MTRESSPARWLFVDAIPHFGGHEVMLLRWLQALSQTTGGTSALVEKPSHAVGKASDASADASTATSVEVPVSPVFRRSERHGHL